MRVTITCLSCGGSGEDLEDSSRDCCECFGAGVVSGETSAQQLHQADADPRLAIDPVIDEE